MGGFEVPSFNFFGMLDNSKAGFGRAGFSRHFVPGAHSESQAKWEKEEACSRNFTLPGNSAISGAV